MIEIPFDTCDKVLQIDAETLERANLQGADLHRAVLDGLNLRGANLRRADLRNASLINADISKADLGCSSLFAADLERTVAVEARFDGASLYSVNLYDADLTNATLRGTCIASASMNGLKLCGADLQYSKWNDIDFVGVDLTDCLIGDNTFVRCRNLHQSKGLSTVRFKGLCAVDVITFRDNLVSGNDIFLQGIGYEPEELALLRTNSEINAKLKWRQSHFGNLRREERYESVHEQSEDAWHRKDYWRYVDLLEPIEDELPPLAARKLDYSRRKLGIPS